MKIGSIRVAALVFVVAGLCAASNASAQTVTLQLQTGATVEVADFLHNRYTVPNPSNPGNWMLMGSRRNCPPTVCPASWPMDASFSIGYDENRQFFNIALEKQPIWAARARAERFLLRELHLPKNQLCLIKYSVGTDYHTSATYTGRNLGFSFCPFAVHPGR